MIYIGIDPGLTGAVAVIDGDEVEFFDTPTYQDGKRTSLDERACGDILRELADRRGSLRCSVFIEKVNPMPSIGKPGKASRSMGVTSAFNFGQGFGVWKGALGALRISFTLVTPQAWKKVMMAGESKEKDASRVVARRLFPVQCEESLSRKKDHGRADALLIAEYGRRLTERA